MRTRWPVLALPLISCAFVQSKLPASVGGGNPRGDVIDTKLPDAQSEVGVLDGFGGPGARVASAEWLPRGRDGTVQLAPGLWGYAAQSYCLHAGTHGPSRGDGYLYAPLHGAGESWIRHIAQRSVAHMEIPQKVVQTLIWSILARVKVDQMGQDEQLAAAKLLEPEEILQVNGGAVGTLVPDAEDRLLDGLPSGVRAIVQAEDQMHDMILQGQGSYDQLESVAVLAGAAPRGPGSRDIPDGRWSWHPGGYFVSYRPTAYWRTAVEIYVPETIRVARDGRGRIVSLSAPGGDSLEIAWGPTIVDRVGVVRTHVAFPERVFVEHLTATGPSAPPGTADGAATDARRIVPGLAGTDLDDVRALAELALGLDAQLGAGAGDLARRAWMRVVCHAAGPCARGLAEASRPGPALAANDAGGGGADGGAGFDPSGSVATPGNTGAQRLEQSSRPHKSCDGVKHRIDEEQKIRAAFSDPSACAKADTSKDFQDWVGKQVFGPSASEGSGYESPMYTDPTTCNVVENPGWGRGGPKRAGESPAEYDADRAHEGVHAGHCKGPGGAMKYNADMSFPCKLGADENAAYGASIAALQGWYDQNCH